MNKFKMAFAEFPLKKYSPENAAEKVYRRSVFGNRQNVYSRGGGSITKQEKTAMQAAKNRFLEVLEKTNGDVECTLRELRKR